MSATVTEPRLIEDRFYDFVFSILGVLLCLGLTIGAGFAAYIYTNWLWILFAVLLIITLFVAIVTLVQHMMEEESYYEEDQITEEC